MIVVDANVIVQLFLDSPLTPLVTRVQEIDPEWRMPPLWRFELAHALGKYIRAGKLDLGATLAKLGPIEARLKLNEGEVSSTESLATAFNIGLSAYDAAYAVLAKSLKCKLLTWDGELLGRVPRSAIRPEDWLAEQ